MRDSFPLQWPDGWPRTPAVDRGTPKFGESFAIDRDAILRQLVKFRHAANVVITSNLPTNRSGQPYASRHVEDPGIAVWWVEKRQERVMACDRWRTAGLNLSAIARTIEALRSIDRWGTSQVVDKAFGGFTALPPGAGGDDSPAPPTTRPWRVVLAMPPSARELAMDLELSVARTQYKKLAKQLHPDHGGTAEQMAELNTAMADAERELAS